MSTDLVEPDRLLLLPGWCDSDASHWQSRWETEHRGRRVEQHDWLWPKRGDWIARLEEVVLESERPAVLVAHSLGCHLVAAWAARSPHTGRVAAALLVAPPDCERADMPPNLYGWRPIVRAQLPFRSRVVVSSDDPYATVARIEQLAGDWGSDVVDIGPQGHINSDSALGAWPAGWALLQRLLN